MDNFVISCYTSPKFSSFKSLKVIVPNLSSCGEVSNGDFKTGHVK